MNKRIFIYKAGDDMAGFLKLIKNKNISVAKITFEWIE